MKVYLMIVALIAVPSIALAHSGTLLNTAANYVPIILAVFPMLLKLFSKLVQKVYSFFIKKHS